MLSRNILTLENYLSQAVKRGWIAHSELNSAPLYTNRLTHCFDRLHNNAVRIQLKLQQSHWGLYWKWNTSLTFLHQQLCQPCTRCRPAHTHTHTHLYKPRSNACFGPTLSLNSFTRKIKQGQITAEWEFCQTIWTIFWTNYSHGLWTSMEVPSFGVLKADHVLKNVWNGAVSRQFQACTSMNLWTKMR